MFNVIHMAQNKLALNYYDKIFILLGKRDWKKILLALSNFQSKQGKANERIHVIIKSEQYIEHIDCLWCTSCGKQAAENHMYIYTYYCLTSKGLSYSSSSCNHFADITHIIIDLSIYYSILLIYHRSPRR